MKKKLFILMLLICGLLAGCIKEESSTPNPPIDIADEPKTVNIEILQMNDIHGHIENEGSYGGLARATTLINQIRNETEDDNTILIGNGDMLQETGIARVGYGKVVIDAMSQMKFDMMGVGNHEFDWGFDRFLEYFDGNSSNGEASFPLINSNIYYQNQLVTKDNVSSSLLIEKDNVKVGILSYIGDVYSSINANMTEGYVFKGKPSEIADDVLKRGADLKYQGADIIIVNIHDGESSSCKDYEANQLLANLKYDGNYLVDAVINGHTHTKQDALIQRKDGIALPVVQSAGKLADFGRIDLKFETSSKKVTSAKVSHISVKNTSKEDISVQKIIQDHYNASKDILEEVYCQNLEYIQRYDQDWQAYISNVMMASTGATASICNTGAFRNNVTTGAFDFNTLYALNPFDNHIILCEISGMDLKRFYDANKDKEIVYTKEYGASIATDQTYILAIIDYVYFGSYFAGYRTDIYTDTNLVLRDLIAMDLRLRRDTGFKVSKDYSNILLSRVVS
ncbi:MAG: metallophosphoesterase [Roseburia sp.]|nr:metallophosphoesterase [Anaeroplasma bactoclasticum]MCM1196850.1 metallophosphoesterase [Roseburia sp.]MCM1557019.1 metallophosphoesterase [Anaeroplasma bactoclasticum]